MKKTILIIFSGLATTFLTFAEVDVEKVVRAVTPGAAKEASAEVAAPVNDIL